MTGRRGIGTLVMTFVLLLAIARTLSAGGQPMPNYTESLALRLDASLTAVAFFDDSRGIACGDHGTVLRTIDGGRHWSMIDSGVNCRLEDVLWLSSRRVLIVGGSYDPITGISRGVVLRSDDGGSSWRRGDDSELPKLRKIQRQPGAKLIAVGDWSHSLLTNRLESHNDGTNWDGAPALTDLPMTPAHESLAKWVEATRAPIVVRDACRIDDDTICAVGDHGVITISRDGGRTWDAARGSGRQTCVLIIARDPSSMAWSLLGSESLENRIRTSVLLSNVETDREKLDVARQATAMLGGASVDWFGDTSATENGDEASVAHRWMQIHRPAVVLVDDQLPTTLQDALLKAATDFGAARVVHYSMGGHGNTSLHRDALLAGTGVLASDLHLDASHLVAPHRAIAHSISLQFAYDVSAPGRRGDSVTSGMALRSGHRLESRAPAASRRRLQMAQARMQQSRRVQQLVTDQLRPARFEKTLTAILDQTAKEDQFRVAWSVWLGTVTRKAGREQQQIALNEIAHRFSDQSYGRWARLRADAIDSSREWAQLRTSPSEFVSTPQPIAPAAVPVSPFQDAPTESPILPDGFPELPSGVNQASAIVPLMVKEDQPRPQTTDPSESGRVDLSWEFHPLVLLKRDAERRRGEEGLLQVATGPSADLARLAELTRQGWSALVRDEAGAIQVRRASHPPRLDGILDDACWQSALPRAGGLPPLRMAYDDQYLYFAIVWNADQMRGGSSDDSVGNRDDDLTGVDRIRLRLDSDRDLLTSMQLQISSNGRTHDAIDDNPSWQPTWYRDVRHSDGKWIAELALSRHDVAELPIPPGEVWYASLQRIPAGYPTTHPVMPDPTDWTRAVFQP